MPLHRVGAFGGCENILAVYKGKTYDYEHIDDLYKAVNGDDTGLTIENGALKAVSPELTEVVIPNRVTSFAYAMNSPFFGCENLKKVTFGTGITELSGTYFARSNLNIFFVQCPNITEIIIPEGVTSIGYKTFSELEKLTKVTIPDGMTAIGNDAFMNCKSLTNITIPDSVTSIGTYYTASVWEDDSIIYEFFGAFEGCENIKVTYKGKTYDYAHIDDLYKAINGN